MKATAEGVAAALNHQRPKADLAERRGAIAGDVAEPRHVLVIETGGKAASGAERDASAGGEGIRVGIAEAPQLPRQPGHIEGGRRVGGEIHGGPAELAAAGEGD